GPALDQLWRKVRANPGEFAFGRPIVNPRDREVIAWHSRRAEESEATEEWFAAAWHVTQLINAQAESTPLAESARLFARRAQAHAHLSRWQVRVVEDYSRAIKVDPGNALHWRRRADTFFNMWQWEQAIQDYSKAIELKPEYWDYWGRAVAYDQLRR